MSNYNGGVNNRRKRALQRLEKVLPVYNAAIARQQERAKTLKGSLLDTNTMLMNADIKSKRRIEEEIQTLKSRIK